MERQTNNIDDLLRQRLYDVEVPPPAFVWPNVEHALHRRKRRFLLWFLAAGLAGAGIWMVWSRPLPTSVTTQERQDQPAQPVEKTTPQASIPANPATGYAGPAATPDAAELTANTKASNSDAAIAPAQKSASKSEGAHTAARQKPKSGELTPLVVAEIPAGNALPEATGTPTATPELPTELPGLATATATFTAPSLLPARLSALDAWDRQTSMPFAQPRVSKRKAAKKCYDFHTNRQAWLLDVYAGPSFVRKTLDTGNPEFKAYVQDRLLTEHSEPAFNLGLRASYLFAENFIVRTGLHYDQFTEKFEYIDPNFINTTIRIQQQLVNGQWVTVTDTVIEYGSNYVKTYNRFGMLDIPLQAALELRSGATGISLNLGGSVNVLFWKRGNMLELNGKPASFTPNKHQFDVFQPRVSLSLLGSIQWYYHVGPKTRLFAEPYYRHILEPVTKPGYPVKQSYGIGGIRVGMTRIMDLN
jgi:hypothetical protein